MQIRWRGCRPGRGHGPERDGQLQASGRVVQRVTEHLPEAGEPVADGLRVHVQRRRGGGDVAVRVQPGPQRRLRPCGGPGGQRPNGRGPARAGPPPAPGRRRGAARAGARRRGRGGPGIPVRAPGGVQGPRRLRAGDRAVCRGGLHDRPDDRGSPAHPEPHPFRQVRGSDQDHPGGSEVGADRRGSRAATATASATTSAARRAGGVQPAAAAAALQLGGRGGRAARHQLDECVAPGLERACAAGLLVRPSRDRRAPRAARCR